jgi:hypothetical protein
MTHRSWTKRPGVPTALTIAVALVALTACSAAAPGATASVAGSAAPVSAVPVSQDSHVVNFGGVQGIKFGDLKAELSRKGHVATPREACGPVFTAAKELSPVFDGERLVLIWVNPPYRTPEGATVGTTLDDVRRLYPTAKVLTPPSGSYVFPGLLVTQGDRAYLFLHDGQKVQKTIVGYAESVNKLYERGVGQC